MKKPAKKVRSAVLERIIEARRLAQTAQNAVEGISRKRIAELKTYPLDRLRRMSRDPRLTEKDQKVLEDILAQNRRAGERSSRRGLSFFTLPDWLSGKAAVYGLPFLILFSSWLAVAYAQTPGHFQVFRNETPIIVETEAGALRRIIFPRGSVARFSDPAAGKLPSISFWFPGSGYQTAFYRSDLNYQ